MTKADKREAMERNLDLMQMTNNALSALGKKCINSGKGIDEILNELQLRSSNLARATFEELQAYALRKNENELREKYKGKIKSALRTTNEERDLYPHFIKYLKSQSGANEYIFQTRSNLISGKWKNPDAYLVRIYDFKLQFGFSMEIETFEIKPILPNLTSWSSDGIFEARSHSDFANAANLVVEYPFPGEKDSEDLERAKESLADKCREYGLGFYCMIPQDPNGKEWEINIVSTPPRAKFISYPKQDEIINLVLNDKACPELERHIQKYMKT